MTMKRPVLPHVGLFKIVCWLAITLLIAISYGLTSSHFGWIWIAYALSVGVVIYNVWYGFKQGCMQFSLLIMGICFVAGVILALIYLNLDYDSWFVSKIKY